MECVLVSQTANLCPGYVHSVYCTTKYLANFSFKIEKIQSDIVFFLGFVVSCSVDSERNATYMALGSFLPIVMLCGKYHGININKAATCIC